MVVEFKNGKKYIASTTNLDWFYSIYLSNLILRPSCYYCRFYKNKFSDITLGDDWSLDRDTKNAHSLIISNSEVGKYIISKIKNFEMKEVDEKSINQPNTNNSPKKPDNYDEFWSIYKNKGYLEAQKYFGNNTFKRKMKVIIADIIDMLNLRNILKKIRRNKNG